MLTRIIITIAFACALVACSAKSETAKTDCARTALNHGTNCAIYTTK
jgi:hypothetical protein